LLLLVVIADVLRPNSLLRRSLFGGQPASRQKELLDGVRRGRVTVPDRTGALTPGTSMVASQTPPA
jgi:hypothetical protein